MSQQAARRGPGPVAPGERQRKIVRINSEATPLGLRVTGILEVDQHLLPFRYHCDEKTPVEFHERYVDALHEKGVAWVGKRAELADAYGQVFEHGDVRVEIVECNLALYGPFDWRLVLAWRENGRLYEQTLHYRHPGDALSADAVLAMIRKEVEGRAPLKKSLKAHEEVLRALRG